MWTTVFIWIERTAFSIWARESPSLFAFPGILILHAVGMGFLVGTNVAINLRILGLAPGIPLASMRPFFKVMWAGFWINAASGIALLIAYPTKALTNPIFYLKLTLIALALAILATLKRYVVRAADPGEPAPAIVQVLAGASLACWIGAIFAGRLLAYTYVRLMSDI